MSGGRNALIIATGEYDNEGLRRLAAPEADAIALAGVLGDPAIGNFAVQVVSDETSSAIQERIEDFLADGRPDDVLLLHFSCHGLKNDPGELFFAARNTRPGRLESTAVPAGFVQRCLRNCRSGRVVLLLDCCFGGAFSSGLTARAGEDLHVQDSFPDMSLDGRGRAIITATGATQYAFEGNQLTGTEVPGPSVFTQVLVEGLATGDADRDGDGLISLSDLYGYVYNNVRARNPHQAPQRIGDVQGDLYVAHATPRHALPEDLATSLRSSYPVVQMAAVNELGSWLAGEDPVRADTAWQRLHQVTDAGDPAVAAAARAYLTGPHYRAARLLTDAQNACQSITDSGCKELALTIIAEAVAATDPERAQRIAQSITDYVERPRALGAVAKAAVAKDWVIAWRIARSITHDNPEKVLALCGVAEAVAATDPDHAGKILADAERIARSIPYDIPGKALALCGVAEAVAATDPDHAGEILAEAEGIASSITQELDKGKVLCGIAEAVAVTDLGRAENIARSITSEIGKARALLGVAKVLAATASDRAATLLAEAEDIARSLQRPMAQAWVLSEIAESVAVKDPDHGIRLIADAQKAATVAVTPDCMMRVLRGVAVTDPDRAERIARSFTDEVDKAWALSVIAEAAAAMDPDRAERITRSMTDESRMVAAMLRATKTVRYRELYCARRFAEYAFQSSASGDGGAIGLSEFAEALSATDLVRAERIARSVSQPEPRTWALLLVLALANATWVLAT